MKLQFLISSEWGNRKSHHSKLKKKKKSLYIFEVDKLFISKQDIGKFDRLGVETFFRGTQLSQGDRTYLPSTLSPRLHSQGPDDSEKKRQPNVPALV